MDPASSNPAETPASRQGPCRFCADVAGGRVSPDISAWIRPDDSPLVAPPMGECFSLVYSRAHERTFADLRLPEAVKVVELWRQIYHQLAPQSSCVLIWETFGEAVGQTERHPHGQGCGVSFLPDTVARELKAVSRASEQGQLCPFCREVREASGGPRAVLDGQRWLAFIPEYARYPYQTHLVTRAHHPNLGQLDDPAAIEELASSLPRLLRAYNRVFQAPMPYMLVIHQLADEKYHLHVEVLPVGRAPGKLKFAASGEMGFGLWINDSAPEVKAAELREVLALPDDPDDLRAEENGTAGESRR